MLPELAPDTSVLDYLRDERRALQAQFEMLTGIIRWYLGPLGAGVIVFYAGIRGWSIDTLLYTLAVLALYAVIYLGNRAAATRRIQPGERPMGGQENGRTHRLDPDQAGAFAPDRTHRNPDLHTVGR